jgi:hypothetical protein
VILDTTFCLLNSGREGLGHLVALRSVQRGEAKLVVKGATFREFPVVAPEDVNRSAPLLSVPLPERARPAGTISDHPFQNSEARLFVLRGQMLPEKHETPNHIPLRIPIDMHN